MLLRSGETESAGGPLRVVAGIPGDISQSMNIFFDDNYLLFAEKNRIDLKSNKFAAGLFDAGRIVIINGKSREEQVQEISDELYRRGRMFVLLEGGATLAGSFLSAGMIDQYMFFVAPRIMGGGPGPVSGARRVSVADALKLRDVSSVMLKDDLLINAYM